MPAETRGQHLRSMGQKFKPDSFFKRMVPDRSTAATGTDEPAFHGLEIAKSFNQQSRATPFPNPRSKGYVRPIYLIGRCAQNALRGDLSF